MAEVVITDFLDEGALPGARALHHYGLAYGDGVAALEGIADDAGIPVVHL